MVKLQINMDDKENRIVAIYKAKNGLVTKEQAVKEIIKKFGGE